MSGLARIWLLVILVLSACGSNETTHPVKLGAVYNLSGGQASLDQPSWNGAQLAAAQINAAGGLLDRPLSLLVADGKTDTTVLAAASASVARPKCFDTVRVERHQRGPRRRSARGGA